MKFHVKLISTWLPFILFFFIIIAFITLQPTSAATVLPTSQSAQWNQFINTLKQQKSMNTRAYWEMREFYSPGTFAFDPNGLSENESKIY